jgi:D-alanyl-D-alanine carboxypeptidase
MNLCKNPGIQNSTKNKINIPNMKTKIITTILLLTLSFTTAFAQSLNTQKLDSLFSILAEKNKSMGSLAISKNGKTIYSKSIGYSLISQDGNKAATSSTKYRIGSISKMFTATIIFQLIEEGKLKLETSLDTYFPSLPNASKITVGNLLNHRSGLHNFTNDPDYLSWMTNPKTHDEMIAVISKYPVDFQPDEKFSYSNSNYVVLGYIIEKIEGKPYSVILKNRITSRIGIKNTYYGGKTDIKNNECYSYKWAKDWVLQPETDMSIPGGAGSLVSTPEDLTRFITALFSLKLVSEKSLALMKTMRDGYGMGMFQIPFYSKKGYGHNGGIDGFASSLGYFPEDSLAVSYITNGLVYPVNEILIGVLSIYFNKEYTLPVFRTISLKSEDLDKYLGVYSSAQIPLKIEITKNNSQLLAQATGQSSFPLEPVDKDKFTFDQAGIKMEFAPDNNQMTLKQGGGTYLFKKDK